MLINTLRLLDALWRDLRVGMRLLIRNPTFAVVAVLTLALGTGANAAIFQLVNAVRFRTRCRSNGQKSSRQSASTIMARGRNSAGVIPGDRFIRR